MIKTQQRFRTFLFLMVLLFASGTVNAQIPITKALKDVSKIYDTKFIYEKSLLEGKTTSYPVEKLKDMRVEDILKSILYPNNLVFLYIKQNYYTIVSRDRLEQQNYPGKNYPDAKKDGDRLESGAPIYPSYVSNNVPNLLSNQYIKKDHTVKGQVRNDAGEALQGVSVIVVGSNNGTMTNSSGEYLLNDVPDDAVLAFSYVGFTTEKVTVERRSVVDVVLHENNTGLNEVVVVGYGTQKKINLTGAVDVVSGKELQNRSAPNVTQLMQGLSPNLNIQMSTSGGEPGSSMSWNLRGIGSLNGNASPLILIDGVESGVDDLDPDNIESISILKDASASAIYGSRALLAWY